MSILSKALRHQITWGDAASQIGQWATNLVRNDATASAAVGAITTAVKQGASDAIGLADTALADHFAELTDAAHAAADAALVKVSGGALLPAVPLVNGVIDQIALASKAAIDAWALQAKANLAPATPGAQAQPSA